MSRRGEPPEAEFDVAGSPDHRLLRMKSRALRSLLLPAVIVLSAGAHAQTSLPKDSPFVAQGGAAAPATAPGEAIEFAGVLSSPGKKADLVFLDKATKKTHWVPVGETVNGISVISYDERLDQATVKINGTQKVLPLRKAAAANGQAPVPTVAANFNVPPAPTALPLPGPAPANQPAPTAPTPTPAPAPTTPEAVAKQEQEARMLVSDLLEIGMAQRKAYEEAQRKAAEGTPPPSDAAAAQNAANSTSPSGQPTSAAAAQPTGPTAPPPVKPGGE